MLLIEIVGGPPSPFHLEFHPRVTVVTGLDARDRRELAEILNDLLIGESHFDVHVDVGGTPQYLTTDLLAQLGLIRQPVDNIVDRASLPGARVIARRKEAASAPQLPDRFDPFNDAPVNSEPVDAVASTHPPQPTTEAEAPDAGPFREAHAELQTAQQRVADFEAQLDAARLQPPTVSREELETARIRLLTAKSKVAELTEKLQSTPKDEPVASKTVRIVRLRQVESAIEQRIIELKESLQEPAADTATIERLVVAADNPAANAELEERGRRLQQYRQRWAAESEELEKLRHLPRPPQWLVVQTKEQLEEAQAKITAFTYQLKEGINVGAALARAEERLAEATEAWDEIENGVEGKIVSAEQRLSETVAEIGRFLDLEPGFPMPAAMDHAQAQLDAAPHPLDELVEALSKAGVSPGNEDAIAFTHRWLKQQDDLRSLQAEIQRQLAEAVFDQGDIRQQIKNIAAEPDEDLHAAPAQNHDSIRAELDEAIRIETDVTKLVADLEQAHGRSAQPFSRAGLEVELQSALAEVETAGRKVDYFARLHALRSEAEKELQFHEPGAAPEQPTYRTDTHQAAGEPSWIAPAQPLEQTANQPWWERPAVVHRAPVVPEIEAVDEADVDVSGVNAEELEFYLLARAANLRMVGRGESVPLIVNGAFDDLAPQTVNRVLDALAKVSSMVQVVYLSSGTVAEQWASRQDEFLAATVRIER